MKKTILILTACFLSQITFAQNAKETVQMVDELMKQNASQLYSVNAPSKIFTKKSGLIEGNVEFIPNTKPSGMSIGYLYTANAMKPQKIYPSEVDSILIGDLKVVPLEVKIDMASYNVFAFALNVDPSDKMKLFRIFTLSEKTNDEMRQFGGEKFTLSKQFVTQFPDDNKAWPIGGVTLSPFHKYMSKATKDCKTLSEKIEKKEDGYTYKALALGAMFDKANDPFDVIYKIMDEYNNCK